MTVTVDLPTVLAGLAGAARLVLEVPHPASVADVLDVVGEVHPAVERRVRDETGAMRRYVNVYVDGGDVRALQGAATPVPDGAVVLVVPSIAGG
ncbi:MAG: MoaD/ThiS family protein [Actinomycetota bacterium]|nr:MoaD/ThiS family protein [Actinomycetota bacterium]